MEKLSMAALNRLSVEGFRTAEKRPIVLVLDNVRSGLNVGSIFRTADAFLVEKILLCGITAQPPHREILKTALGSTDSVAWEYFATTEAGVRALQAAGYRAIAVEQATGSIELQQFTFTARQKYALILGNEVDGVGQPTLALCDSVIEIPQFGTKHSLNVAVAAGILLWEAVRALAVFSDGR